MELPRLEPIYRKYKDQGLSIIAIDSQRDAEGARKFIEENELTFNMIENGEGDEEVVRAIFGVISFPTTFLIGKDGKIRYCHVDFSEGDEVKIEEQIVELLGARS